MTGSLTPISQLPNAGTITGTELVPIVQNGTTVKTTTVAISGPALPSQTFITVNHEPGLASSRQLAVTSGDIVETDAGAGSTLTLGLAATAVTAASYGSASSFPNFTVDAKGRLTAASSVALTPGTITVAASSLVGNATGSPALGTSISIGATFAFSGSTLQTTALTGDVTASANSFATTIAANAVTYAKFQQVAASSLVGNATGSLANATGITLGATLTFSGSALQTAALTGDVTASANSFSTTIASGAVTLGKMANLAANSVIGNNTGSPATPIALTQTQLTAMVNTATASLSGAVPAWPNNTTTFFRGDGTYAVPPANTAVIRVNVQKFTSSGTYTPHSGMLYATIECQGPGGGGGGTAGSGSQITTGGGGGAGGYSRVTASAAAVGASQTVTVGTGGAGGTAGNNAGSGGSAQTSVGSICIANVGSGGGGGATGVLGAGGAGGAAGTGDLTLPGQPGGSGLFNSAANAPPMFTGAGGNAFLGFGGQSVTAPNQAGQAASGFGGGGSGGFANTAANEAGGAGTNGIVIITEYCNA